MDGLHGSNLPAGLIYPIYIIAMQVTFFVALGGECVTSHGGEMSAQRVKQQRKVPPSSGRVLR